MPTVCKEGTHQKFEFQQAGSRQVQAGCDGGQITSDAGAVLLREVAERGGMFQQMAACFSDHRDQDRIRHSLGELLSQRVLAIACGYEDLNDHEQLRADPMWGLLAGKADPQRQPIAGKSTLNRLEAAAGAADPSSDRYRKIAVDPEAFQELFVRW